MPDFVVHGPVSWNFVVDLDVLPAPRPHTQFAIAHREVLGGTSAGKSAHLRDRGIDVELHTVLGTDDAAASIENALQRAGIPFVARRVDGPSERHLNLMDRAEGRVSPYLDLPSGSDTGGPTALARLLEPSSHARAVVLDLSQRSRDLIDSVAALDVPSWTDLHDYDGRSDFHAPFLHAASFVFMNGDRLERPQDFLRSCVNRGAQVAACTLGAEGAVAVDAERRLHRVPATPVHKVVDTNGAGDGFMAGFMAAHLDGADQASRALGTVQLNPLLDVPDW